MVTTNNILADPYYEKGVCGNTLRLIKALVVDLLKGYTATAYAQAFVVYFYSVSTSLVISVLVPVNVYILHRYVLTVSVLGQCVASCSILSHSSLRPCAAFLTGVPSGEVILR